VRVKLSSLTIADVAVVAIVMGKRKSSSKPQTTRKADPLPTTFTCLFCNHEKSVSVKLNKKAGVGQLDCRTCGQSFQCPINYLSAAVDVYAEWVDAADAVAAEDEEDTHASSMTRRKETMVRATRDEDDDIGYEGEGIIPDDDDD
jgi:transcription elongation factor Elf1